MISDKVTSVSLVIDVTERRFTIKGYHQDSYWMRSSVVINFELLEPIAEIEKKVMNAQKFVKDNSISL